ncbi:MAG: SLBB domain-containing protein [Actinomycetota bacterium]|nr:SLBB domain-containing protein [Actinomycetota bacterium]
MTTVHRVLFADPVHILDDYIAGGGGEGLEAARKVEPDVVIAELEASGLRGRGGAGFPTGTKWRTVAEHGSPLAATAVVVNAAEGEPGTFKDRSILRANPYHVLEGALIAAYAVGATQVVFGMKRTFRREVDRVRAAIQEAYKAGWADPTEVEITLFEGPSEYLYGEETALLESIAGRYPFPRIAPPFRRGVLEVVQDEDDVASRSGLAAPVDMAGPEDESVAPPTLVDNVETLANVPGIIAKGAGWFREYGTEKSPGTIVCTVTGSVRRPGVGEVPMGTPLREVIEAVAGGARRGQHIQAVLPGVANGLIGFDQLDTPVTYEDLNEIGSGLGSAGFMVFDDADDLAAVAAGVSRFLAVESCGQCTPCKQDGLALSELLAKVTRSEAEEHDLQAIADRVATIGDRARCYLALQHQAVMASVIERFRDALEAHVTGAAAATDPVLIAEMVDIEGNRAIVDERFREKQPDWTYGDEYSGQSPADRFGEHRSPDELES